RRTQFQLADVREARLERVAVALPVIGQARRLRREIREREEPEQNEQARADLKRLSLCHLVSRDSGFGIGDSGRSTALANPKSPIRNLRSYIRNAVMTKSIASVAIEENTTVRVVAYATPSLVGGVV